MKRICLRALCLLTAVSMPLGTQAIARNSHAADFFSTPDTKASGAPEFSGRPLSEAWANGLQNNSGDMPRLDLISSVPSITPTQRKQLTDLWHTTRKQMQPYYDEVTALQKRLKEIRAQSDPSIMPSAALKQPVTSKQAPPDSKVVSQESTTDLSWIESLETEEQVNTKLDETRHKIRDSADLLRDKMFALLSDEQKDEMVAMRHGTLIIDSDSRTDVPPPAPPAAKAPVKNSAPAKNPTTTTTPGKSLAPSVDAATATPAKGDTPSINTAVQASPSSSENTAKPPR